MATPDPQTLHTRFLDAMNAGDVETVVSLYEPNGVIAPELTTRLTGHAAIRSMVTGFLAQRPVITLHHSDMVRAGDVALVHSRLTVTTTDEQGDSQAMVVEPMLLVRRQADGEWRVVIDWPFPVP